MLCLLLYCIVIVTVVIVVSVIATVIVIVIELCRIGIGTCINMFYNVLLCNVMLRCVVVWYDICAGFVLCCSVM